MIGWWHRHQAVALLVAVYVVVQVAIIVGRQG